MRKILLWLARHIGSSIRDARTGRSLGRALLLPWRGKIHVIAAEMDLIPIPLPQQRLTYAVQEIGFTVHDEAASCSVGDHPLAPAAQVVAPLASYEGTRVLLVMIDHRSPEAVRSNLERWTQHGFAREEILLAYGGTKENFETVDWPQKFFVEDPRLRTRDHQREAQSYREIFERTAQWLEGRDFTHVLLMEYDHVPLIPDLAHKYLDALAATGADVLGHEVRRMDATIHPQWLVSVTTTYPTTPVWSMCGTGQFWKRAAWEAVAADHTHADWYLELDLPTTAADHGFRLASVAPFDPYFRSRLDWQRLSPDEARKRGAWTLHPVKS